MPAAQFNIGRDGQAVLVSPFGRIDLNYTGFKSSQKTHDVTSRPLNGYTTSVDIPDMWDFSIDIDRNSAELETVVSNTEAAFYAGGTLQHSSLYLYVNEIDGSQSVFEYGLATWNLTDAGNYKQDDKVPQTIAGKAGFRKRIG